MGLCLAKHKRDGDDSDHDIEFTGGNVHLITTEESWEQKMAEAKRDGRIVIANFSAAWCGPCRIISPFYIELSEKHPSLMFLVIDVDELTDFSTTWDIKATPTGFFSGIVFMMCAPPIWFGLPDYYQIVAVPL
ncbi:unnamed protein product [Fraxinus pennsylvanica]|uniref:Thioredoxin domain-containing protein n=1 Tax=Fraxinus pennsylvanica TaxID=56036 RepID=A0AAD1ZUV2_9LAMI|nr:unnamed protein product [Fraxinus pennsylvanica]